MTSNSHLIRSFGRLIYNDSSGRDLCTAHNSTTLPIEYFPKLMIRWQVHLIFTDPQVVNDLLSLGVGYWNLVQQFWTMTVNSLRIKLSIGLQRELIIFGKCSNIVFKGNIHADSACWFLWFLNLTHCTDMRSAPRKKTLVFNNRLVVESIFCEAHFRLRSVLNSRQDMLHAFGVNSKSLICGKRHHLSVLTHIKYRF